MAHLNITDTAAHNIGDANSVETLKALIVVNTGFTGTIIVADKTGTIATITNPVVGQSFPYWDINGRLTVTSSATGDITVNTSGTYGAR